MFTQFFQYWIGCTLWATEVLLDNLWDPKTFTVFLFFWVVPVVQKWNQMGWAPATWMFVERAGVAVKALLWPAIVLAGVFTFLVFFVAPAQKYHELENSYDSLNQDKVAIEKRLTAKDAEITNLTIQRDKALATQDEFRKASDIAESKRRKENQNFASRSGNRSANEQTNSGTWRRLTDADRSKLSVILSDGSYYKIRIYRTPTLDCIRLADDFYNFFAQLQWTQTHRPGTPPDSDIRPGIYVATLHDNVNIGKIKNIKERSGAMLLIKGMEAIGLPVIYQSDGGTVDDLEIRLHIGVKPE